jgi:sugar O-acyltransferase (sialic acid O-acetyltransferase NeuD family)
MLPNSDQNAVYVPLLNPNEPEALVSEVSVQVGQKVKPGDPICLLETTKAISEVSAEFEGYIHEIRVQAGRQVNAGDVICLIGPEPAGSAPEQSSTMGECGTPVSEGVRITRPAQRLIHQLGLSYDLLPRDRLITEELVRSIARDAQADQNTLSDIRSAPHGNELVIYGGGGHAKAIIDLLSGNKSYRLLGIVDDNLSPSQEILGIRVLGNRNVLQDLFKHSASLAVNGVGAIGDTRTRVEIFRYLNEIGFGLPTLVHCAGTVEASAAVSGGVQVFAHSYVGSAAEVGFGAIINTGAVVSHDCRIGDYAHIAPGALLAGSVVVGTGALIGMAVTIDIGVKIGDWARIGNGARIHTDVPPEAIVRSGMDWPAT